MPDHLANDFLSAPVCCLGTSLGTDERLGPLFAEQGKKLKVALTAVIESGSDFVDGLIPALSGDEHGQLAGDLIVIGDGKDAVVTANPFFGEIERDHGIPRSGCRCHTYSNKLWHNRRTKASENLRTDHIYVDITVEAEGVRKAIVP